MPKRQSLLEWGIALGLIGLLGGGVLAGYWLLGAGPESAPRSVPQASSSSDPGVEPLPAEAMPSPGLPPRAPQPTALPLAVVTPSLSEQFVEEPLPPETEGQAAPAAPGVRRLLVKLGWDSLEQDFLLETSLPEASVVGRLRSLRMLVLELQPSAWEPVRRAASVLGAWEDEPLSDVRFSALWLEGRRVVARPRSVSELLSDLERFLGQHAQVLLLDAAPRPLEAGWARILERSLADARSSWIVPSGFGDWTGARGVIVARGGVEETALRSVELLRRKPGIGAARLRAALEAPSSVEQPAFCQASLVEQSFQSLLEGFGAGQEREPTGAEPGLIEGLEEGLGELKFADGARGADVLLLASESAQTPGPDLMRQGTWRALFPWRDGLAAISSTSRWDGHEPRRDFFAWTLEKPSLAWQQKIQFSDQFPAKAPLLKWQAADPDLQDSMAQLGVCPWFALELLRQGRSVEVRKGWELRPAGREKVSLAFNGASAQLDALKVDLESLKDGPRFRYYILDEDRWPVVIGLADLKGQAAPKFLTLFALRCG